MPGVIGQVLALGHQLPNDVAVGRKCHAGVVILVGLRGVHIPAGIGVIVAREQRGTVAGQSAREPNNE